MKSDLYTKTVLTIIAIALSVLCFRDVINPREVSAQAQTQRVIISGVEFEAGTSSARVATIASPDAITPRSVRGVPTVSR
jgi:hypothetical protein